MQLDIRVTGLAEVEAAFRAAERRLPAELSQAGKRSGDAIKRAARVPRRTGQLESSIDVKPIPMGATVGTTLVYASPIHWGRRTGNVGSPPGNHPGPNRIVGRRFLTQAAKSAEGDVTREYEKGVDDAFAEFH